MKYHIVTTIVACSTSTDRAIAVYSGDEYFLDLRHLAKVHWRGRYSNRQLALRYDGSFELEINGAGVPRLTIDDRERPRFQGQVRASPYPGCYWR
jgi:hypothetical protein